MSTVVSKNSESLPDQREEDLSEHVDELAKLSQNALARLKQFKESDWLADSEQSSDSDKEDEEEEVDATRLARNGASAHDKEHKSSHDQATKSDHELDPVGMKAPSLERPILKSPILDKLPQAALVPLSLPPSPTLSPRNHQIQQSELEDELLGEQGDERVGVDEQASVSIDTMNLHAVPTKELIQKLSLEMQSITERDKTSKQIIKLKKTLAYNNEYRERLNADINKIQAKLLILKQTDKQNACKRKFDELEVERTKIKELFDTMYKNPDNYQPQQIDQIFNDCHLVTYKWLAAKKEFENVKKDMNELPDKFNLYMNEISKIEGQKKLLQNMLEKSENLFKITSFREACLEMLDTFNAGLQMVPMIEARLPEFLEDKYFVAWLIDVMKKGRSLKHDSKMTINGLKAILEYRDMSCKDYWSHRISIHGVLEDLMLWQSSYDVLLNERKNLPIEKLTVSQTMKADILKMVSEIDELISKINKLMPDFSKALIKLKSIDKIIMPLNTMLDTTIFTPGEMDELQQEYPLSNFIASMDPEILRELEEIWDEYYAECGKEREEQLMSELKNSKICVTLMEGTPEENEYLTLGKCRKLRIDKESLKKHEEHEEHEAHEAHEAHDTSSSSSLPSISPSKQMRAFR